MKFIARFVALGSMFCLFAILINSLSSCGNVNTSPPPPPPPSPLPTDDGGDRSISIPDFPWPPPKASAKKDLPKEVFSNAHNYRAVDSIITSALEINGYVDKSYFTVPSGENFGFVLVTQMEQINPDASSMPDDSRWNTNIKIEDLSFTDYLKAIFFTKTGYFRVIVFIVTDIPFQQTGDLPERETALSWLQTGSNKLPDSIVYTPYTDSYTVTALIYEYELKENEAAAKLQKPSKHSGKTHLVKSKLWDELGE